MKPLPQGGISDEAAKFIAVLFRDPYDYENVDSYNAAKAARSSLEQYIAGLENEKQLLEARLDKALSEHKRVSGEMEKAIIIARAAGFALSLQSNQIAKMQAAIEDVLLVHDLQPGTVAAFSALRAASLAVPEVTPK